MNRISRIAIFALSLAAAGTALAESPTPEPAATPASTAPLVLVTGVTHDFDFGAEPFHSTRSRQEVRLELLAAIADGSLPTYSEGDASPDRSAARVAGLMASARL